MFWIGMVLLLAYHGSLFGGAFQTNLKYMIAILPVQMMAAYSLVYFSDTKLADQRVMDKIHSMQHTYSIFTISFGKMDCGICR